jgi:hypothetical protein
VAVAVAGLCHLAQRGHLLNYGAQAAMAAVLAVVQD